MLTIQIRRAHVAILAVALFVSLLLGGAVAGTMVGRALVAARVAPTRVAPRSVPASNPVRFDDFSLDDGEDVFEEMKRERCEQQWRSYQQDYTDYQTKGGVFRPIQPSC